MYNDKFVAENPIDYFADCGGDVLREYVAIMARLEVWAKNYEGIGQDLYDLHHNVFSGLLQFMFSTAIDGYMAKAVYEEGCEPVKLTKKQLKAIFDAEEKQPTDEEIKKIKEVFDDPNA